MLGSMMVVLGLLGGCFRSDMHRPPALLYMRARHALQADLATLISLAVAGTIGADPES